MSTPSLPPSVQHNLEAIYNGGVEGCVQFLTKETKHQCSDEEMNEIKSGTSDLTELINYASAQLRRLNGENIDPSTDLSFYELTEISSMSDLKPNNPSAITELFELATNALKKIIKTEAWKSDLLDSYVKVKREHGVSISLKESHNLNAMLTSSSLTDYLKNTATHSTRGDDTDSRIARNEDSEA
jgi:hypothetical protein